MKRYIKSSHTISDHYQIRIRDGEYFNDVALAKDIADEIYVCDLVDNAAELIEEAARYYTSDEMQDIRKHDYNKIVEKATTSLEMRVASEEESKKQQESMPKYQVYGFRENYVETGYDTSSDSSSTNDPAEAITIWFKLSEKYPTCTSITAKNKSTAMELLQFAAANEEMLRELASKYKCPYKIDYIVSEINKKVESGRISGFYGNYPDQVHPFANG